MHAKRILSVLQAFVLLACAALAASVAACCSTLKTRLACMCSFLLASAFCACIAQRKQLQATHANAQHNAAQC